MSRLEDQLWATRLAVRGAETIAREEGSDVLTAQRDAIERLRRVLGFDSAGSLALEFAFDLEEEARQRSEEGEWESNNARERETGF